MLLAGCGGRSHETEPHAASATQAPCTSSNTAREGVCVGYDPSFGGPTVFSVVDSGHALKMPGYDARLLASTMTRIHVFGPLADSPDYPNRQALLVSEKIVVSNTGSSPLRFDQGGTDVDLMIAPASDRAAPIARPQIPYPNGAPSPQLDQEGAIPAAGNATGWVSFVVRLWARRTLNSPPTDLEFFRPGHEGQGYVGRIRLWKAATPAGLSAMSFRQPTLPVTAPPPTTARVGHCTDTWTGMARDADYGNPLRSGLPA